MALTIQKKNQAGRMLNEFLVSLGLLFILLVPDVAILSAAVTSSSRAASEDVALDMARNSMEASIAQLGSVTPKRSYEIDGTSFSQSVRLVPLQGERAGLTLVVVSVEWVTGDKNHHIRLERYVRGS
jgi:hypothetical protein